MTICRWQKVICRDRRSPCWISAQINVLFPFFCCVKRNLKANGLSSSMIWNSLKSLHWKKTFQCTHFSININLKHVLQDEKLFAVCMTWGKQSCYLFTLWPDSTSSQFNKISMDIYWHFLHVDSQDHRGSQKKAQFIFGAMNLELIWEYYDIGFQIRTRGNSLKKTDR